MKKEDRLNDIILENLAAIFNASLSDFTFYPGLPDLPTNENDFAKIVDSIPTGTQFFTPPKETRYFSQVYGKILHAQRNVTFAIKLGLEKYKDPKNWLVPELIPKNTPTLKDARSAIKKGSKTEASVKSDQHPASFSASPDFPNIISGASLLAFYQKVAQSRFTASVTFDTATSIPVAMGGWFYSGAFLEAYKTPDNWDPSIISWEEVFGKNNGILKNITTSIALVADMNITLVVPGDFDEQTVEMLQGISDRVIFPFYQQLPGSQSSITLQEDGELQITVKVPQKRGYLFGIKYQSISSLLS